MNLFKTAKFDITRHYQHGKSGVVVPLRSARKPLWVIERSLLRLKLVALAGVPEKKRADALRLETLAWRPFAVCDYYAQIVKPASGSGFAVAWLFAWDRDSVEIAQTAQGLNQLDMTKLPEVVPAPSLQLGIESGLRVLGSDESGFETQIWERGVLQHSRWWEAKPDALAWQNFQRSVGMDGTTRLATMPLATNSAWRLEPDGFALSTVITGAVGPISNREVLWLAAVAFMLTLPTIWYANAWWSSRTITQLELASAVIAQKRFAGLFESRNLALDQAAAATFLHGLFMAPDTFSVLSDISERFNQTVKIGTFQIQEFEIRDAKLRLVVGTTAPPSATAVIKALELSDRLKNVQINLESTRWIIVANVAPLTDAPEIDLLKADSAGGAVVNTKSSIISPNVPIVGATKK